MTIHTAPSKFEQTIVATDILEDIGAAPSPAKPATKKTLRKILMASAAAAVLAGAGWYAYDYWTVGQYLVSTDDAYVKADNTTIAPKVSGYLDQVLVADNEPVKEGQVLARIDDRDYRVALDQARADVAAAVAAVASKEAQVQVQEAMITAARATLEADRASVTFAAQENQRYTELAANGSGSVQNAQQAQARIAAAYAALARDTANLTSALKQLDLLKAEIVQAEAAVERATAARRQAELNLSYTAVVSPGQGVVANRTLRVGQFVQAGTQLLSVVPIDRTYIVANFKETQLTNVRPGQSVEVALDMFPGKLVHGKVDSIAPASGQEFALLPPDNATGNFTKVVQRIPVKIALQPDTAKSIALRPGMSVIPTIATRSAGGGPRTSDVSDGR